MPALSPATPRRGYAKNLVGQAVTTVGTSPARAPGRFEKNPEEERILKASRPWWTSFLTPFLSDRDMAEVEAPQAS